MITLDRLARALANLRGMDPNGQGQGFGWPGYLVRGDPDEPDWEHSTLTQHGYAMAIMRECERLEQKEIPA